MWTITKMIENHGMVELTLLNELPAFLSFMLVSLEASGYFFMALYLLTCLKKHLWIVWKETYFT